MMRTVSIILVSLAGGLVALATAGCNATLYAGGTNPMPMNASATGAGNWDWLPVLRPSALTF